jgi:hypothetical protein
MKLHMVLNNSFITITAQGGLTDPPFNGNRVALGTYIAVAGTRPEALVIMQGYVNVINYPDRDVGPILFLPEGERPETARVTFTHFPAPLALNRLRAVSLAAGHTVTVEEA